MEEVQAELLKWYEKFKELPPEAHLLCPRISNDDDEDYKVLDDPESQISPDEKKKRIREGQERRDITYWNTLVFGFDKRDSGEWLDQFTDRLNGCLRECADCVLNWHMYRKPNLHKFAEQWDEEAELGIGRVLDELDIKRIRASVRWARQEIEAVRANGQTFKRSNFGDRLGEVHIAIYEALCCMPYLAKPEDREDFQIVFLSLQGKTYLKLGSSVPLPGMTFFLFDPINEQRRGWARHNWQTVINSGSRPEESPMTEEQFDWAVGPALIKYITDLSPKDPANASQEDCLQFEQFWQAVDLILRAMSDNLILSRFRNLEVSPNIFEFLFSHISRCWSEGVLVSTIRVLTTLFRRSPKAIGDVVGDAKPSVVADMVFGSPLYKSLLSQSHEDCWTDHDSSPDCTPFPTSWVVPWLQSLSRDRRYDACDALMETLFASLARNAEIGEPGRAACVKAGLDALRFTMQSFVDSGSSIGSGSTNFFANATFDLVSNHRSLILSSLNPPPGPHQGWSTFRVADAAVGAMEAGMKLDMKLFAEEYLVLHHKEVQTKTDNTRRSKDFWESVVDTYERFTDSVDLASRFLLALEPIVAVEHVRPLKKDGQLNDHAQRFNKALSETIDVLTRMITRISELDVADLNILLTERKGIKAVVALSLQGESDFAEACCEILKTWTEELSRSLAYEHMSRLHPYESLSALIWSTDRVLQPPDPWGPIRPLHKMSLDVLHGLTDASDGVLRKEEPMDSILTSTLMRWWKEQWRFVSTACRNIEGWSQYIPNSIMTEFCREIMELAEALIAEDGLITSAIARSIGKPEEKVMLGILAPAKDHFRGMENMIRLKDRYLVETTVRVLCKILTRLRENKLEINPRSRTLITDACIRVGKGYKRNTNLKDNERAELLRALGHEEDVEVVEIDKTDFKDQRYTSDKARKQSSLDAWSKSGLSSTGASQISKPPRTNRDDVRDLSKSLDNPILRQFEQRKLKAAPKVPDQTAISALKANREREKAEKKRRDAEIIAKAKGQLVPGEGSGLHGLGVLGKDHGRSEIMINSSDEEPDSEADSDDDGQLAALSTGGSKPIDEAARLRHQALLDKTRQPVKKTRRVHSTKEMRARLIPPMDRLHNIILAWDIFHSGDEPPSGPKGTQVATKYPNPKIYQDTFLPLLASEAWRAFVTAKGETTSRPFEMPVASRASVDSYLEVTFNMPVPKFKDSDIREGDIILVSEAAQPLQSPGSKSCLARVQRTRFKGATVEISYRITPRDNAIAADLRPRTTTYGLKITNMNTIEREYAALESLQYYDLMDEILKAEPSPILKYSAERIDNYSSNWDLNQAQAMAVLGAQNNDGFTLIQGPPGTGKTKTITAMVGALLSDQLNQAAVGTPVGAPVRPIAAASQPQGQNRQKKLLLCAPSNAAVDELVLRLKGGVKTVNGRTRKINVLRLGRVEAINAAVKDVSLDELVRVRLEGDTTKEKAKEAQDKLHEEAGNLKYQLAELRALMDTKKGNEDRTEYLKLSGQFDIMKKRQIEIGRQIDASKATASSMGREAEIRRKKIQQEILNSAHVLCATLSGSGHEMFRNLEVEFETVIIDEAAQSVELTALIPLKYGCYKCILVGDPKQLPPTVLSQSAAKFGYDQSLFVRMQQNHPDSVHLLDTQYRMHPEISQLPSKEFYQGQLKDGPSMVRERIRPWHRSELLGPYRFFDIEGVQERGSKGNSLVNVKELDVAVQLYDRFRTDFGACDTERKIGIITPYKAQLEALRRRFAACFGEDITSHIDFNTTDAFQGRECEIIIFSCVRASATGGIGFVKDIRRMNVGLTRAKSSLWILGDARALSQGEYWNKLILDAQARNRFTSGDVLGMFRKPLKLIEGDLLGPVTEQAHPSPEDVTMSDAIKIELPITTKPACQNSVSEDQIKMERHNAIPQTAELLRTPEVIPRSGARPVIQTTDNARIPDVKKRTLEGETAAQPTVKRVATDRPRASLMNKFGGKKQVMKPPKAPKDPAAISSLGLEPPERPKPVLNGTTTAARGLSSSPAAGPAANGAHAASRVESNGHGEKPPAKTAGQPGPPPMPRKKAKPSLFINKRR